MNRWPGRKQDHEGFPWHGRSKAPGVTGFRKTRSGQRRRAQPARRVKYGTHRTVFARCHNSSDKDQIRVAQSQIGRGQSRSADDMAGGTIAMIRQAIAIRITADIRQRAAGKNIGKDGIVTRGWHPIGKARRHKGNGKGRQQKKAAN